MPPLTVLIKPASGDCNLRCRYCFYKDETDRRETPSYGVMSVQTLEQIVKKAMEYADMQCTIGFQGGEPTLAGLDFFRTYIELVKKYNRKGLEVAHTLQTNGTLLTDEWAAFLKQNNFLVGLSIDGTACIHNQLRTDAAGRGSFDRVWRGMELLKKHEVDFNVLTVATKQSAAHAAEIYDFFVENGLLFHQYIPCLAPLDAEGCGDYAVTAEEYGQFLCDLFDRWYEGQAQGKPVYVRYFENLAGMLLGYPPENCGMCGRCVNQYVVEADGGVYPCDFYVLDDYRLGSLVTDSFDDLNRKEKEIGFIQASLKPEPECLRCELGGLCRGGCRRDRQLSDMQTLGKSCFCAAYRKFLPYAVPRIVELLKKMQGQ